MGRWMLVVSSMFSFGGCGPSHGDADGSGDGDSSGGTATPDPRVALVSASYSFDSGCSPFEVTGITLEVTAIDTPIASVVVTSYDCDYMAGHDPHLDSDLADALPIAPGDSVELRFRETRDGWAGECASFDPDVAESPMVVQVALDVDHVELHGTASISCGWSEC